MVSQHGRPDDGTDAAGLFNAEFFAPLKPASEWPGTHDKEELTAQLLTAAAGQVSRRRIQLLAISAGQRLGGGLRRQGRELDQAVRQRSAGADRHRQQDQVRALHRAGRHRPCGVHLARPADHPDRHRSRARRALRPRRPATSTPPSRSRSAATPPAISMSPAATGISRSSFALRRNTARAPRRSRICGSAWPGQGGAITQIPLSEVASINLISGAAYIYREQQERYLPIKFSVRDRDLGSAIQEAQEKVATRSSCRRDRGSSGSASSAICRTPSSGCRSWCRSAWR